MPFREALALVETKLILNALTDCKIIYRYSKLIYKNVTRTIRLHIERQEIHICTVTCKLYKAILEHTLKTINLGDVGISNNKEGVNYLGFTDDDVPIAVKLIEREN